MHISSSVAVGHISHFNGKSKQTSVSVRVAHEAAVMNNVMRQVGMFEILVEVSLQFFHKQCGLVAQYGDDQQPIMPYVVVYKGFHLDTPIFVII